MIPRWRGLRVVAADGSKVRLALMKKGVGSGVDGVAFGLSLPGIELFLDFVLHEPLCDERQMLFEAIDEGVLRSDDLRVLDRGFPSRLRVSMLTTRGIPFCIRCDNAGGFKAVRAFLASGLTEEGVSLRPPGAGDAAAYGCPRVPTAVRLIRVATPNGKIHVLMTFLFDSERYPAADFAALYHGRWRIEESFKRLKHRLGLEHTSGFSWHAARQDFGAKAICENLNALAAYVASEAYLGAASTARINRTQAFDKIKRQRGRWLLRAEASVRNIRAALREIARNSQNFVPDRHIPRHQKIKPHRFFAYKPVRLNAKLRGLHPPALNTSLARRINPAVRHAHALGFLAAADAPLVRERMSLRRRTDCRRAAGLPARYRATGRDSLIRVLAQLIAERADQRLPHLAF